MSIHRKYKEACTLEEFKETLEPEHLETYSEEEIIKLKDQMERLADFVFDDWLISLGVKYEDIQAKKFSKQKQSKR